MVDTIDVNVCNPRTGKESGWILTFAGPDHEKTRQARASRASQMASHLAAGRHLDLAAFDAQFAFDRLLGWRECISEGASVPFTEKQAFSWLSNPKLFWLRDQCIAKIGRL